MRVHLFLGQSGRLFVKGGIIHQFHQVFRQKKFQYGGVPFWRKKIRQTVFDLLPMLKSLIKSLFSSVPRYWYSKNIANHIRRFFTFIFWSKAGSLARSDLGKQARSSHCPHYITTLQCLHPSIFHCILQCLYPSIFHCPNYITALSASLYFSLSQLYHYSTMSTSLYFSLYSTMSTSLYFSLSALYHYSFCIPLFSIGWVLYMYNFVFSFRYHVHEFTTL